MIPLGGRLSQRRFHPASNPFFDEWPGCSVPLPRSRWWIDASRASLYSSWCFLAREATGFSRCDGIGRIRWLYESQKVHIVP
jgi:hypothetical protein